MLWKAIQQAIASVLPASEFDLWIKPIVCAREDAGGLTLQGPDRFFCAWVEQRYLGLIRQKAAEVGVGDAIRFQILYNQNGQEGVPVSSGQLRLPGVAREKTRVRALHPAFTFEHFVQGQCNALAHSVCKALADNDCSYGCCLFMDSGIGLGKSHLTQAVVHQVLRTAPATRLHYLTAQQFTADMVQGLRNRCMDQFSKKYIDDCDMLLLEDVHTLGGRDKTQEELNIVLDYLLKSGRRIILTSALPPDQIAGLDAECRSRMTSGIMANIQAPDFTTRMGIIRHKMAAQGLLLDDALVEYMAEHLRGDVRRIESAVMGVKARSRLLRMPPDLGMIREVLGCCSEPVLSAGPTAEAICRCISTRFKVSREELRSRSRKRSLVFPRQLAMYFTRKLTKHSLSEIGELYCRDHSTVMHAIRAITQQMVSQTAVREQVHLLEQILEKR